MANIKYIINAIIGPYSSLELIFNLKNFFNNIGCNNIFYYENNYNNADFRFYFLLNSTLRDLNKLNDVLVIGSNIRLESPLINSIYRKNYLNNSNNFKIYNIGLGLNYNNYPLINIGSNI
jgi:NADH dehydrogenase/NADH:ubiquinone oxidoreductase subunit G